MIQYLIIGLLFVLALVYIALVVYRQFSAKEGCAKGCSCSSVDIEKIEKALKTKSELTP